MRYTLLSLRYRWYGFLVVYFTTVLRSLLAKLYIVISPTPTFPQDIIGFTVAAQ